MKLQYHNIGFFDGTKFKRCLDNRTNPNMIIWPDIATPYVQIMHFSIMKIRPRAIVKDEMTIFNILYRVKLFHGVF